MPDEDHEHVEGAPGFPVEVVVNVKGVRIRVVVTLKSETTPDAALDHH